MTGDLIADYEAWMVARTAMYEEGIPGVDEQADSDEAGIELLHRAMHIVRGGL